MPVQDRSFLATALCLFFCFVRIPASIQALPNPADGIHSNHANKLLHRSPESLKNTYSVLRHGQSQANVAKLIASSPEIATKKYGLSEKGKEQAAKAVDDVIQNFHRINNEQRSRPLKAVLFLASDLLRAEETAQIVQRKLEEAGIPLYQNEDLGVKDGFVIETRMRERWFGDWDETSDTNYANVWKDDAVDPNHKIKGVESVNEVMERITSCVQEWDQRVEDCFIICVAHGDVLQILQTAFAKMDGSKHRTLEHLETAKLRCLKLAAKQ